MAQRVALNLSGTIDVREVEEFARRARAGMFGSQPVHFEMRNTDEEGRIVSEGGTPTPYLVSGDAPVTRVEIPAEETKPRRNGIGKGKGKGTQPAPDENASESTEAAEAGAPAETVDA